MCDNGCVQGCMFTVPVSHLVVFAMVLVQRSELRVPTCRMQHAPALLRTRQSARTCNSAPLTQLKLRSQTHLLPDAPCIWPRESVPVSIGSVYKAHTWVMSPHIQSPLTSRSTQFGDCCTKRSRLPVSSFCANIAATIAVSIIVRISSRPGDPPSV